MPERRQFRPRDLLRQVQIQELDVSPDGEWVVYTRRTIEGNAYRKRLWRVPWRGGRPEQLTNGELDARPRFSPDGSSLVFLSRRSGKSRAWLLPLEGGEPRELRAPDADVADARWSPDGRRLLLLAGSGEPRFSVGDREDPVARRIDVLPWRLDGAGVRDEATSIWLARPNGGKPRRLTAPDVDVFGAAWSPDGERIGFVADLRPEAALLELPQAWSVPAGGGDPEPLAELPSEVAALGWSRGGRLALIGVDEPPELRPAWANTYLFLVENSRPRRLAPELDRSIGFLTTGDLHDFSARFADVLWLDDDNLAGVVCDRGESHVYRFGADGSAERLTSGEVVCSHLATGGGRLATVATDGGSGAEVYAVEGGLRRLTRDGGRWLARSRRDPESLRIPHSGGHELDAWLVRARRRRRAPLVLHIHGGPHLAHGPAPWLETLALADAGFSVLYANPRGSAGYGQNFTRGIEHEWGGHDDDDLMRVVDWAIDEGLANPRRIGLLGLSYGGYMTNWLLGHHPGRFAAAVSENPVTDLAAFMGTGDFGAWIAEVAAGVGGLGDGRDRLADRSPSTEIHRNEAPLLLLQCENDLRCPPEQSEIVFATLRKLGRPVEMVRYPGESHLMFAGGRPDRRVDRLERILAWFERYL
ncbi:MAG TPA: S9 family peptidase [Gaiellaceae bacterium]